MWERANEELDAVGIEAGEEESEKEEVVEGPAPSLSPTAAAQATLRLYPGPLSVPRPGLTRRSEAGTRFRGKARVATRAARARTTGTRTRRGKATGEWKEMGRRAAQKHSTATPYPNPNCRPSSFSASSSNSIPNWMGVSEAATPNVSLS